MISCECKAAFARLENYSDRVLLLDQLHPNCSCQCCSVSEHSPAAIENSEFLIRILVAPQHIHKKTREPVAAALTDAERNGLSILRENYANDDQIIRVAERLVTRAREKNGDIAGVFGVFRFKAVTARHCRQNLFGSTFYCVYDTALPDLDSHGEVFQQINDCPDEQKLDRRRAFFRAIETTFIHVNDFRNGLLRNFASKNANK